MPEPKWDPKFSVFRKREWVRAPGKKPVRIIATGKTAGACKKAFEAKRVEAITKVEKPPALPDTSKLFTDFAAEWLATYPTKANNRANTLLEKEYHLRIHIVPFFDRLAAERGAPVTITDVNSKVIDQFTTELATKPQVSRKKVQDGRPGPAADPARKLSPKSVNNILQTLRKMLATARRWGEIESVPEVENRKIEKPEFDFFTFEETDRLLTKITDENDLALIMAKVRLGLRASELLGLRWDKIDFGQNRVRIDQQIARKSHALVPVKAGVRTIPMTAKLAATLKGIRHLRAEGRGGWVFCDPDGRPFSLGHLRKVVAKWCRRAGLREMHPHGLRHTFASHLIMKGVILPQVQEWLGHTSITMTLRYAHLAPKHGDAMINLLEEPAPSVPAPEAAAAAT